MNKQVVVVLVFIFLSVLSIAGLLCGSVLYLSHEYTKNQKQASAAKPTKPADDTATEDTAIGKATGAAVDTTSASPADPPGTDTGTDTVNAPVTAGAGDNHDSLKQSFQENGIHPNGVWNSKVGKDAFFQCAVMAMANSKMGRHLVGSMIRTQDASTYIVKFPNQPAMTVTDDDIARLELTNREKWASIIEAAFDENVDQDQMIHQLQEKGQPAIGLALTMLSGKDFVSFRPDAQGVDMTDKLLAQIALKQEPVLVSLKHRQEVKGTPLIKVPVALALTAYDPAAHVATLKGCFATDLTVQEEGLERIDDNTYKVPVKLFPKYVRFVASVPAS